MNELKQLEGQLKEFYGDRMATEAHLQWLNNKISETLALMEELNQVGVN